MQDARRFAPAAARNREPIAAALRGVLPARGLLLEIASGSGEHALHLARAFPDLVIQPSDPDPEARASIAAWREAEGPPNLRAPLPIDAAGPDAFPPADAVLCINMVHIAPWPATLGLLSKAAEGLPGGGPLVLYGPFLQDGIETAPSNLAFDAGLRAQDPRWGLRRLEALEAAARPKLVLAETLPMPAHNIIAVFRRAIR